MKPFMHAAILLPLLVAPATGQDPASEERAALHHQGQRQSTGFVLEAGEHDIQDLVDSAAHYLGRNILLSPQEVQVLGSTGATVRLHKKVEVDALGCEELVTHLLYVKGLAMVPLDEEKGFWEVIAMQGPRRGEIANRSTWKKPEEILRRPNLKLPVLTAVPLEHINATIATNSLRPFFSMAGSQPGGLTVGNVGDSSAILLQGFTDQVAAAIRLLREVDKPLAERDPQWNELVQNVHALQAQVQQLRAELEAVKKGKTGQ